MSARPTGAAAGVISGVKWLLMSNDGTGWWPCRSISYKYNPGRTHQKEESRYHGNVPPCGDGNYVTVSRGQNKIDGLWRPADVIVQT